LTAQHPLSEFLPHAPPMILLDELVSHDEERVACRVVLRPDSLFVEQGRVPATLGLEYMAQTIAVLAGLQSRAAGRPPRIGYLLGTRELELAVDFFEVGDELRVECEHLFGENQLGAFKCAVHRRGERVAAAILNVYQEPAA
jgi:predicted hotdog family 3-hydroxylacyl-ACP dehydratase